MTTDLEKEREAFEAAVFDAIDAGIKVAFDEAADGGEIFPMQVYDSICETLRADGILARAALAAAAAPQAREDSLPMAQSISDEMMDVVDRLGSEADQVDPRAWDHLMVYAPERFRTAERELAAIDKALRGKVNDPDPLQPLWAHSLMTTTTYGLASGLLRERDALLAAKNATPQPAGRDARRMPDEP